MRGYAKLKAGDKHVWIRDLRNRLAEECVVPAVDAQRAIIFGAAVGQGQTVLRQFLLERYAGSALFRAILVSMGDNEKSIAYPLPKLWREFLIANGLKLSRWRSGLGWGMVIVLRFLKGIADIGRLLFQLSWSALQERQSAISQPYAYFYALSSLNVPQFGSNEEGFDICSWYAQWPGHFPNLDSICHSVPNCAPSSVHGVKVSFLLPPYRLLRKPGAIAHLALWGGLATIRAFVDMLCGKWSSALMLAEAAKSKAVQLCSKEDLALEYLFHFSGNLYRPLWTYELERHGKTVTLYFYSTYEQPKPPSGYEAQKFEWGPLNWPKYLVWDAFQEQALRRDLGDHLNCQIVGPISFSDSSICLPALPENSVAVFDIQPHRKALVFGLTTVVDYWHAHPDVFVRFLEDLAAVTAELGSSMVLKAKRNIGNRSERRYNHEVRRVSSLEHVRVIDPSISARRFGKECCASVSMPFTSTALYSRALGLPSAYYDPVGWIDRNDRAAHGIPVLSGRDELRIWLRAMTKPMPAREAETG